MSTFRDKLAAAYAAWGESKARTPQDFYALMDGSIRLDSVLRQNFGANPLGRSFAGKADVLTYFAAIAEAWQLLALETDRIVAEGDTVVWIGRVEWRNRRTMRVMDTPKVDVWTHRDGQATALLELFDSYAFARAIGLVDPPTS